VTLDVAVPAGTQPLNVTATTPHGVARAMGARAFGVVTAASWPWRLRLRVSRSSRSAKPQMPLTPVGGDDREWVKYRVLGSARIGRSPDAV
jgi:hypothetical protein